MIKRRAARENVFKLVFEYLLTCERNELSYESALLGTDPAEQEYVTRLYGAVIDNCALLQEHIARNSHDFSLNRIFKVDLAILYLALADILYAEIPYQIAINEAVELAKKYSTEKSPSYINGVLKGFVISEALNK